MGGALPWRETWVPCVKLASKADSGALGHSYDALQGTIVPQLKHAFQTFKSGLGLVLVFLLLKDIDWICLVPYCSTSPLEIFSRVAHRRLVGLMHMCGCTELARHCVMVMHVPMMVA